MTRKCGGLPNVPQPELPHQEEPSSESLPPCSSTMPDSDGRAVATKDAMDVEKMTDNSEDVARSSTTRSNKDEAVEEANDSKADLKPHIMEANLKEKVKANVDNDDADRRSPDDNLSYRDLLAKFPTRPDLGRDPKKDFLHTVPKSHGGPDRKRAVFRVWPRRPDGKPIEPAKEPIGTLSPDDLPWGATLYDFYNVNTAPGDQSAMSHMTSSALLQTMKALGEYDPTAPEFEWALSESIPMDEDVAKAHLSIVGIEAGELNKEDEAILVEQAAEAGGGNSEKSNNEEDEEGSDHDHEAEDEDDIEVDPDSIPPPPEIPVTSPFHPSHYPKPWPLVPFEKPLSIHLQECIPSYLLPQTLYVHDPFNLLPARERSVRNTSWNSRPDIVRTYSIRHTYRDPYEEREEAEDLEDFKARTLIVMRYMRTEEQIKNYEPVIEVPLPPCPRRMTSVEEGHLYLSPVAKIGEGHHSVVYKGEWELPRDLFVRPTICPHCLKESVASEIQKLKDTGRWEKLLRAAGWGPTGFIGCQSTEEELDEVSDDGSLGRDGEIVDREVIFGVRPTFASLSYLLEAMDESDVWEAIRSDKDMKGFTIDLAGSDEDKSTEYSKVATIRINPQLSYEHGQRTCKHTTPPQVPRTVKFTVTAKLSLKHDCHLIREVQNYQRFPEPFFHHYDGYTLIDQLHTIVPVSAIVPQFYGYYTPKQEETENSYLSPILLLEYCGSPIVPEFLSREEQEEFMSMLLRFHRAGWLHESIAPRNFVVQMGKPTESSLLRPVRPAQSFRLIDFGRSRMFGEATEQREEEEEALRMFHKLRGKMSLTPYST